ncbi:MAG: class I SAM-dependent methyltransferase [Rhizomicrobium sp.]|jgi:SAM-dependent methyltransferase
MNGRVITSCRYCASPLRFSVLDLGKQPYSNSFPKPGDVARERAYPLHVRLCEECFLVQTDFDAPPGDIFTADYAYFSSYSASWVEHARRYADAMTSRFGLGKSSMVVEVASNDGYLLQHFVARSIPCLGVEPTAGTANAATAKGVPTQIAFFGEDTARDLASRRYSADLMAANNVLAHVPHIADFVRGFATLLKPDGVATFEFPHLLQLFRMNAFDTIYHEHFFYLSLRAVERIFGDCGLRVFDIERLATHGGSLRVFACLKASSHEETNIVAELRSEEEAADFARTYGYTGLEPAVARIKSRTRTFLDSARASAKVVAAYGAAAKGSTFLDTCGIGIDDVMVVADANEHKQGRLMPGSHIPIVSPASLRELKPDYVLILPWNLKQEIMAQLGDLRQRGTRFITAIPDFEIAT